MPLDGEYQPSTSGWARRQAERYEATDGREANDLQGRPVIILTSVGAKTGKLRKTALMRVEHDGDYAVVASLGGAPKHPVWYYNLKKQPHVELQDLAEKHDYLAREVTGDEKAIWWERAVATWPAYAGYQKKTDREIPCSCWSGCPKAFTRNCTLTRQCRRQIGNSASNAESDLPEQHDATEWSAPLRSTRSARARVGSRFCSRLGPLISAQIERAIAMASGSLSDA